MKYPAHRHLLSISVLEPSNVSLGKSGSWEKKNQHERGSFFKKKQLYPLHPMDFKLWVSCCMETMRKGEKLFPLTSTVPVSYTSKGALKKYLSESVSPGERQQPSGKGSASTTSLKYKLTQLKHIQKFYFFTCFSLVVISRSCLSTLKADFTALQWIQYSWHQAEGDLLRTGIFEL